MISRRRFLGQTGLAATALALNSSRIAQGETQVPLPLDLTKIALYVDPLPIPEVLKSQGVRAVPGDASRKLPFYRVVMREIHQKIHRDLPPTRVWGFNNSSPGPIFHVESGKGILVEWANELPQKHFLPIDHTLHGAESDKPEVRCVIHLHGGKTPPGSDGYPEDWVVPGKSLLYHYPLEQEAALLFYHDHTMGINRLNTYAGLQGLFIVRDQAEAALNLPSGPYEIPLILYDRYLLHDAQLDYPVSPDPKKPWVPEFYSNVMLANGKLSPHLEVEPTKYRFRIMNGSNARFYRVSFGSLPFDLIGVDQGLLAAPVSLKRVLLAPAERADIVVDFSAHAGEKILLRSDSFNIMEIRVSASGNKTVVPLPGKLRPIERIPESRATKTRRLTLDENMNGIQESMGMLLNNTPWHMPITEKPVLDSTEIWEIVNLTEDTHPIHLHLVRFQVLDRRPLDTFSYQDTGKVNFYGPPADPAPDEMGWKDTVRCEAGTMTRIIIPFEGFAGKYVWHCHILEHEDNEMMRPFEVLTKEAGSR